LLSELKRDKMKFIMKMNFDIVIMNRPFDLINTETNEYF